MREVVAADACGVADAVDDEVDGSGCDLADVAAVGLGVGVGEQVSGFGEQRADVFEVLGEDANEDGWDAQCAGFVAFAVADVELGGVEVDVGGA